MIILVLVVINLLLVGCKKVNSKIEYYSGTETIYPKNMPAAREYSPDLNSEVNTGGGVQGIYVVTSDERKNNHIADSWYRLTVNRMLSNEESYKLSGRTSLPDLLTFFECTLWYDYVLQESVEQIICIRQTGNNEWQVPNNPPLIPGNSYVIALAAQPPP